MIMIPRYKTLAGQTLPDTSFREGELRFSVESTNEDEFRSYASLLSESGYECRAFREIPSSDKVFKRKNLACTFTNSENNIFLFFDAPRHKAFITKERRGPVPEDGYLNFSSVSARPVILTQCRVGFGMSYAIRLADSSFILIDGGEKNPNDEAELYSVLQRGTEEGKKPRVSMWMFTHPDEDHINLAASFIEKYRNEVDIDSFAYQFPDTEKINVTMDTGFTKKNISALESNIKKFYGESLLYTLHTGQVYRFPGVEFEILWTPDNTYPSVYTSFNEVSSAWRMKFDSGKTVMILGDCMHSQCREIASLYGEYLRSDVLQLAHHGLIGGSTELYQYIDPEICLWTTTEERFLGVKPNQRYQWCLGEGGCDYNRWIRDDSVRQRQHYHQEKTISLEVDSMSLLF